MANFVEGYKSNKSYLANVQYNIWKDRADTAFIKANGEGFVVTIQKIPLGSF